MKSICPCCTTHPEIYGLTKCKNLRVLKFRIMQDSKTNMFVRNNPKLYTIERISHDLPYEDCFTLLQAYSA